MIQVSVTQARQQLPQLLNRVFGGEEFLIVKNKIPVAHLTPVNKEKIVKRRIDPEVFGMWKNRWPESKSSVDIVNEWRKREEMRSYDR